jgi:hypothetical protein
VASPVNSVRERGAFVTGGASKRARLLPAVVRSLALAVGPVAALTLSGTTWPWGRW